MNNEEEIMMKNKIEKREKMDTILAYILIVILLGSILLIIYLKFIKKEEVDTDIHTTKYATINDVVKYLNDSELGVSASTSNNVIVVTSTKEGDSFDLNIPLINNELEIKYNKDGSIAKKRGRKPKSTVVENPVPTTGTVVQKFAEPENEPEVETEEDTSM